MPLLQGSHLHLPLRSPMTFYWWYVLNGHGCWPSSMFEIASRLEDLSVLNNPWYDISTGICCIFFCVSRLRLGRPRTGQGILWCKTWTSGVYRAEALPLMAVQWSDQMRGSCHSLRCRFFSITVFVDFLLRRCSPIYLMFFITSILRSVQEKRLTRFLWWGLELICNT